MEYIISESEIFDWLFSVSNELGLQPSRTLEYIRVKFLKDKQPVELLAEGEVNIYDDFDMDITYIGGMSIENSMEKFIKYDGKQVKTYIEVSK